MLARIRMRIQQPVPAGGLFLFPFFPARVYGGSMHTDASPDQHKPVRRDRNKQYKQLMSQIAADLGGDLNTVERSMIQTYAGLFVQFDILNAKVLAGETIDLNRFCRLVSSMNGIANKLGIVRKPQQRTRDVPVHSLGTYLQDHTEAPEPEDAS
jgi:hypothetical protein